MNPKRREELAKRLMRRLCAFPSFASLSKNPDTADAYISAISQMIMDVGSERSYDAITAAINSGGQFAPSAGDLRLFIPLEKITDVEDESFQVVDERKLYRCAHGLYFCSPCPDCPNAEEI